MSEMARSGNISARHKNYAAQRRLCHRIVQFSSVLFLPAVIMRRLMGTGATQQSAGRRVSVFAEARASAASVVPFIFMG